MPVMPSSPRRHRVPMLLLAGMGLLAACSGGGGSGGGFGGGGTGSLSNPPVIQSRTSFHTAEYLANYGLASVNASAAYAVGGTGSGITVAVIDTGVDVDHPDLAANLHPLSRDILAGTFASADDQFDHGTSVAGVVAALKNDVGMHGVAYESRILAIRADSINPGDFFDPEIADAIDYAVAGGAKVINLSLGGPASSGAEVRTAVTNAVDAGVVIVASSGNSGGAEPEYPARLAADPAVSGGLIIVAGAVDQTNTAAGFQNRAGPTANSFVVAPGVNVVTTAKGGGLALATGTSFAAPHVSGALALLFDVFPTLTAGQAVELLLKTATDLGLPGTDSVYGRGLINLEAAMQPQGVLGIPTSASVAGPRVDAAATALSLGAAFGDALRASPLLGQAIALDAYDRPYHVALGDGVVPARRTFGLEELLEQGRYHSVGVPLPRDGLSLRIGLRQDVVAAPEDGVAFRENAVETAFENMRFSGMLTRELALRLGYDVTAAQQLGLDRGGADRIGLFWADAELMMPQLDLVGRGRHVGFRQQVDAATTVSFDYFRGESDLFDDDAGAGEVMQASLRHGFASGLRLRFDVAQVAEDEALLGSRASGAFGFGGGAASRFYTISGVLPLWAGVEAFAGFTTGVTEMPAGSGLLGGWSEVESSAFGLGIVRTGLFAGGDRLGLLLGQPLRVERGSAMLSVPVAVDLDGRIQHRRERVDMVPSGREIDLQLAYDRRILPGWSWSSWLMLRLQPGHDASAGPAYGAGLSTRLAF